MKTLWKAFSKSSMGERRGLMKLQRSGSLVPRGSRASDFRIVVGRFDRQVQNTPFAVKLSRADITFVDFEGVTLALDTADVAVSGPLLSSGSYEPYLVKFFKEHIKPGMTVLDVGANVGIHAILAARLVGTTGKVLCFEPNSENCRLILLSAHRNQFDNVALYPVAASDRLGHALFSTHMGSNGGLIPSGEEQLLSPSCVVVPTFPLDDLIHEQVHFIKMDTEGAEGLVLGGAKSLIEKYRPVIVSEFSMEMLPRVSGMSGNDFLSYFHGLNYAISIIDQQTTNLHAISDVSEFLNNYGPPTRIVDVALIPRS